MFNKISFSKILFLKILFFRKFCLILFDLILFYFSKKKIFFPEIYCSQLTVNDYCSRITVGHNTKIVLQHNLPTALLYCNTIFQLPSLAIHSCILQYNFHQSSSLQYNPLPTRLGHNTLIVLQYNSNSPLASLIAIQFCNTILAYSSLSHNTVCVLQYNFFLPNQLHTLAIQSAVLQYNFQPSSLLLYNTKIVLQCNFQHPLNLQYNPPLLHIQGHYLTIQCLSCNTKIFFFTI